MQWGLASENAGGSEPWYFYPFLIANGKEASILKKEKKNESLNSFAIHVLYVKYQRVSKSDKVEGRMSHILRLQMKRWGRKGNFQFQPAVSTMRVTGKRWEE